MDGLDFVIGGWVALTAYAFSVSATIGLALGTMAVTVWILAPSKS